MNQGRQNAGFDGKEANVRMIEGMLRITDHASIESTTDPSEVCELHRENRYDLILLDLQISGISKAFDLAERRARVHNILEVRRLHLETKNYSGSLLPRFLPQFENCRMHVFNNPTR